MNELIMKESNQVTFTNEELTKATERIFAVGTKIQKNLYEIAYILNKVNEKKLYEDDGFKNCAQYAMDTFGFKKTMAYTLVKIGKDFTSSKHESLLPHDKGNDFTVTQVEKMLPLKDKEKITELVENGTLTPEMSAKEISEKVKEIKGTKGTKGIKGTKDSGQPEKSDKEIIKKANKIISLLAEMEDMVCDKEQEVHGIHEAVVIMDSIKSNYIIDVETK